MHRQFLIKFTLLSIFLRKNINKMFRLSASGPLLIREKEIMFMISGE